MQSSFTKWMSTVATASVALVACASDEGVDSIEPPTFVVAAERAQEVMQDERTRAFRG